MCDDGVAIRQKKIARHRLIKIYREGCKYGREKDTDRKIQTERDTHTVERKTQTDRDIQRGIYIWSRERHRQINKTDRK